MTEFDVDGTMTYPIPPEGATPPAETHIRNRVKRCIERLEAVGRERVDAVVSADLLLEASAIIRGLEQSLMLAEWKLKRRGVEHGE